ncbi:PspC domain-containing protein [Paenibacillus sp. Marseille-Q4541]|uniref:PspC domain-containing protein n=1 Tax=Paenibacillus sp. Marseille-Q4541 TaxID=2831522 RepID=UPI001BA9C609|nr:PspC domain-containing protein [Paenibacillus sp. Marseille-Q4541]
MTKLYRSRRDKKVTGLLGGLSQTLGMDSTLLRVIFIVTIFFTSGIMIFLYFVAALVVPKEPFAPYDPYGPGPGMGGFPGGGYSNHTGFDQQGYGSQGYGAPKDNRFNTSRFDKGFGAPKEDHLDSMMEDIEKKALKKENDELRKKLSKYEKGEL